MSAKILIYRPAGWSGLGRVALVGAAVVAVGIAAWLLWRTGGEAGMQQGSDAGLAGAGKVETTNLPGDTGQRPRSGHQPRSRPAPGRGVEMASLRDTVAQLKAKAYALPSVGPVPSDQQRIEMLRLTQEVGQITWPGRDKTILWVEQGMTPGDPMLASPPRDLSLASMEEGKKQRTARYSEGVRLIAQIELGKLLRDPQTTQIAVAYLQKTGDDYERAASENIEDLQKFISSRALGRGPDSKTMLTPSDYLQVIDDYVTGGGAQKLHQQLMALELPDFVTVFIEDRVRAPIFEVGMYELKSRR